MSDEEDQFDPKAHKNLLQAISNLGKTQHIRKTTRNEPQRQQNEFQLLKAGPLAAKRHPVGLGDIVKVLKTTKRHVDAGKQLKVVQSTKKVLNKPLEKPQAERIKRDLGYESVKKKLDRWDAVVTRNRIAETQVFPLRAHESIRINTTKFQRNRKSNVNDDADAKEEEALLKRKLTRDELIARRKELAYLKIRESQKSAKARMQNKIKSKKYHKLLKRQKLQEKIKEFEILQKVNPEAALEKLNELERSRVQERASLRHKNTGSWAKNLQIRAKYDKDVRKDLAEQLQISRQLTQKKTEDEEDSDTENAKRATLMKEVEAQVDPFNPWTIMPVEGNKPEDVGGEDANWRKYWLDRNTNEKLLDEYKKQLVKDEDDGNNESLSDTGATECIKSETKQKEVKKDKTKVKVKPKLTKKKSLEKDTKNKVSKITTQSNENIDDIFDKQEDKIKRKLGKKLKDLTKSAKKLQTALDVKKKNKLKDSLKNHKDLSFNTEAKRPDIDEELNYENSNSNIAASDTMERSTKTTSGKANERIAHKSNETSMEADESRIDPTKLSEIKLKQRLSDLSGINNTIVDDDDVDIDDDELEHEGIAQQMTITEAFEDDDIVADFTRDKAKDTEIKNNEIDLNLPGWGSWAGSGISAERQQANKNKRLILKMAEVKERRDENKSDVYINEEVDKRLRSHLVSDIPFPFTSVEAYEASIRAPVGRTFVPETAFRLLTQPAVITQKGQVIEPMDESELLQREKKPRNTVEMRIKLAREQKLKATTKKRVVKK